MSEEYKPTLTTKEELWTFIGRLPPQLLSLEEQLILRVATEHDHVTYEEMASIHREVSSGAEFSPQMLSQIRERIGEYRKQFSSMNALMYDYIVQHLSSALQGLAALNKPEHIAHLNRIVTMIQLGNSEDQVIKFIEMIAAESKRLGPTTMAGAKVDRSVITKQRATKVKPKSPRK